VTKTSRTLDLLRAAKIVPVIRTPSARHAATAVQWLYDSGIRIFEITLTIPDAVALIHDLAREPDLLIGAGTVPDAAAAAACLSAGARFIVAPWVDETLKQPCEEADALLMLGALSPSEVRAAVAAGAGAVKIFPAASAGGPAHIRALRSVFPGQVFCPTGGVEPENIAAYLSAGADFVGIGGALVAVKHIEAGNREAIQATARAVAAAVGAATRP